MDPGEFPLLHLDIASLQTITHEDPARYLDDIQRGPAKRGVTAPFATMSTWLRQAGIAKKVIERRAIEFRRSKLDMYIRLPEKDRVTGVAFIASCSLTKQHGTAELLSVEPAGRLVEHHASFEKVSTRASNQPLRLFIGARHRILRERTIRWPSGNCLWK